jgi:glycosyltransferase involved in cell wall biosynthesis
MNGGDRATRRLGVTESVAARALGHYSSDAALDYQGEPALIHGMRVSVVIPTLNEAENLPHVFTQFPAGLHEVVLVDGHSVDDTIEVARRLRPDIRVVVQARTGKGDALACGFSACSGDAIVMMDADGSTDPAEIPRFVAALADGAEFAKGSRSLPGGGSADLTWLRKWGNRFLSLVVNTLYGTKYTDLCYGYNAFRASCLQSLLVDCPGFEVETLINIRIARLGLKVAEVPSYEGRRINGMSNLRPFRDGLRILRVIVRERVSPSVPMAHVYEGEPQWSVLEPTA